jgi:MFS-type transporter involved in bile tolerance (Atg22 family)
MEFTTPAVWLVMFLAFTNKFSIEMVISSTSTLTKNRYDWELRDVGILGAVDGIMVIPLSFFVGWLSQRVEDISLLRGLLALSILGTALLVDPTDLLPQSGESYNEGMWASVGPKQYIVGSLLSFASLQACESVITSQLSKVVPHTLAKGTFNSGLLSTLVGAVSNCFRQRQSRHFSNLSSSFLREHAFLDASSLQPWAT